MTMTVSLFIFTPWEQGGKASWTVQAVASSSEGVHTWQQARASGFPVRRARPCRASPQNSTAWWDAACVDSLSPKLILEWKWQFCEISSVVSGSAGPASPFFVVT